VDLPPKFQWPASTTSAYLPLPEGTLWPLEPLCPPDSRPEALDDFFVVVGFTFIYFFLVVLGLEPRTFIEPLHQAFFFVMGFFEIGSCKLSAQAGFDR
jgi:hypothetical protein